MDWQQRLRFRQILRCATLYDDQVEAKSIHNLMAFFVIATRGPLTVKELAATLGVPPAMASESIGHLGLGWRSYGSAPRAAPGLVVLRAHPTDGRSKLVEVTEKGEQLIRQMDEVLSHPFISG